MLEFPPKKVMGAKRMRLAYRVASSVPRNVMGDSSPPMTLP